MRFRPSDRTLLNLLTGGVVLALVGGAFLFTRTLSFSEDVRDSAVAGCERQNIVRRAVRASLHEQNVTTRNLPPSFFPDIPPEQFKELTRQGIKARQRTIENLNPADCGAVYPEP